MSCFWDSILRCISLNEMNTIFKTNYSKITPKEFVENLKKKNRTIINVLWNNVKFKKQELAEVDEHIKNYNVDTITNGYLCSCCDPFLILICEIFNINITNNFNGVKIYYQNINTTRVIYLNNNSSHMS